MRCQHFDLTRTQDYLEKIAEVEKLGECFGDDTHLIPISLDIKEMYTNLLHEKNHACSRVCN